jgi:tRNA U34 5-methylaminomethyl-2-thiouridine-forming methyltransferase MnmC
MNEKTGEKNLTHNGDATSDFELLSLANGSHTLVDPENGQAMHSRIGPESEARLVYAERARIEERLVDDESEIVLYDVGMGIAANVLAVFARIRETPEACGRLKVYSFETKPEGLRLALEQRDAFPMLAPWASELKTLLETREVCTRISGVEIEWRLVVGDFYVAISERSESGADDHGAIPPPDFIFFDFYSPKIVPELWSREKFQVLRRKIGDREARLYTYSAATPVRMNLLLAGFFVGEGVSTGVKNETTIAATRLEALEKPLEKKWLSKLETSTAISDSADKEEVRRHPQWGTESSP